MSHIFIAHVEEDGDIALGMALGLEEAGYRTWIYEVDSIIGMSYIVRTGEAVAQADAVVVIISPDSLSSVQVTKEVVRAHESGKHFLPLLRGITHIEFQNRQPEWREAIGSATSITIPGQAIESTVSLIIEGIKLLGIKPEAKKDGERIGRIRAKLDEVHHRPQSPGTTIAPKQPGKTSKSRAKAPFVIIPVIIIAIAVIIGILLILNSGGGEQAQQPEGPITSGTPSAPAATIPETTPPPAPATEDTKPFQNPPTSAQTPAPPPEQTLPPSTAPKPDLVIQDITWSPKDPNMGNDVTFTITFTNRGKDKAAASHMAYYINGVFTDTISVNPIDSGATGKVSFKWKAELGTHKIKAIADFNDSVAEGDEINNEKEINFSGALAADLIIQDITLTPANPSGGDDLVFTVTVKNQGNGTVGQFSVYFYFNGFEFYSHYNIDSLYTGQITTAICQCKTSNGSYQNLSGGPLLPGTFIFKAVADGGKSVAESDETNNSKDVSFSISK